ncbi:serine/threonine-protein kinase [Nonomuraea sp. NPDC052634]|uniref:serine/threonine-protein kinase n=1 Tax=Nonomuraea sp. NPDC052634 TaxID=3155813 RepID=UPI0034428F04
MSDAEREPSLIAGRYRLDERIGSGPMGEVWRGYDTRADWVVAVKVLGARAAGAATREVLRQHAQAVAKVIHPNVAMVLDVGEHDGAPFLVMEHLTGLSLGEELAARGGLSIVEVCDLIGQAAAGLDAAHRAGVVHGQVDPDAFRMAASGVLKVVGFGMDGREPVRGSGRYAAPERVPGQPAEAPGDIYALGCVCYELLCGRPPFEDGAPRGQAAPPSTIRAEVPPELDRLVLAMLDEDPAKRPASGEYIRRTLAAIARPKPAAPNQTGAFGAPGAAGAAGAGGAGAAGGVGAPGNAVPGGAVSGGAVPGGAVPGGAVPQTGASLRGAGFSQGPGQGPGGATEVYPVPPPRAGDTAVYQAADFEPEAPSGSVNRKLVLQLGIAVAVIAAVTVAMVMIAGQREEQPLAEATPTPSPSLTTQTEPTEPPVTPTADSTPEVVTTIDEEDMTALREIATPKATLGRSVPAGGYETWLQRFDQALMAQEAMGGIDPHVAGKAREKLRKAARKLGEGHLDSTLNHVAGVYRDLLRAQEKGRMEQSGPASDFMRDWSVRLR